MQSSLKIIKQPFKVSVLLAAVFSVCIYNAHAQDAAGEQQATVDTLEEISVREISALKKIEQLKSLELSIQEKMATLAQLETQQNASEDNPELSTQILNVSQDLDIAKKSFEQVAIGGVSLDIFDVEPEAQDWREELALVVQPLLENLNHLTEKPRKQEALRRVISTQRSAIVSADKAINSIDALLENEDSESLSAQLTAVKNKWLNLKGNAERQSQLAVYELDNLNGRNESWFDSLKKSLVDFAHDRGLTLLLALLTSFLVWFFFKFIGKLFEFKGKSKYTHRASYRIIKYAQKIITVLFVIISILIVFFIRGDVLLLAITAIIIFSAILGLRNLIPQFIQEARILLNISNVRENEYVMYKGIPWRVASLNVYSKLVNPEIRGILRLPLAEMKDLVSRQAVTEKWFPSSIGDWVLDDADLLYEVIQQTPDAVELQSPQGSNKLIPTDSYYAAGFVNLTRSKRIRIVSRFGLDYSLQSIALDVIPEKLTAAVQSYLEKSGLETPDITTRVEFEQAGESSLDYIIIVQLGSEASENYYRIKRHIQQACVSAANTEGWTIPFPQLTVHKAPSE